jgi:hypothetical protein
MSKIEELLGRNNSGYGLEIENTAVGIRCADHATLPYPQKLALTTPTSLGLHSSFADTEFSLVLI